MNTARIIVKLYDGGDWMIDITAETLAQIDGIPSGKYYKLERRTSDLQTQDIFIRPYYRRTKENMTTIFAVQTIPEEV